MKTEEWMPSTEMEESVFADWILFTTNSFAFEANKKTIESPIKTRVFRNQSILQI